MDNNKASSRALSLDDVLDIVIDDTLTFSFDKTHGTIIIDYTDPDSGDSATRKIPLDQPRQWFSYLDGSDVRFVEQKANTTITFGNKNVFSWAINGGLDDNTFELDPDPGKSCIGIGTGDLRNDSLKYYEEHFNLTNANIGSMKNVLTVVSTKPAGHNLTFCCQHSAFVDDAVADVSKCGAGLPTVVCHL